MAKNDQLLFLPEFRKFINASRTGRRLMPSGKKIRKTTIRQYEITCRLVAAFEKYTGEQLEIMLSARITPRQQEKTRKYWNKKYDALANGGDGSFASAARAAGAQGKLVGLISF